MHSNNQGAIAPENRLAMPEISKHLDFIRWRGKGPEWSPTLTGFVIKDSQSGQLFADQMITVARLHQAPSLLGMTMGKMLTLPLQHDGDHHCRLAFLSEVAKAAVQDFQNRVGG
jgi:hypothetical protein